MGAVTTVPAAGGETEVLALPQGGSGVLVQADKMAAEAMAVRLVQRAEDDAENTDGGTVFIVIV